MLQRIGRMDRKMRQAYAFGFAAFPEIGKKMGDKIIEDSVERNIEYVQAVEQRALGMSRNGNLIGANAPINLFDDAYTTARIMVYEKLDEAIKKVDINVIESTEMETVDLLLYQANATLFSLIVVLVLYVGFLIFYQSRRDYYFEKSIVYDNKRKDAAMRLWIFQAVYGNEAGSGLLNVNFGFSALPEEDDLSAPLPSLDTE